MTDFFDDDEVEFADVMFRKLEPGRYKVATSITIKGKCETRELECRNPAYGLAKLEDEICVLLKEAAVANRKRRKRNTRLTDV
jgi:hypothetical protein